MSMCMRVCVCTCVYVCIFLKQQDACAILLFRTREEFGFSAGLQFSFVITGRETGKEEGGGDGGEGGGGERGKVPEKPDPSISSPFPGLARIDL